MPAGRLLFPSPRHTFFAMQVLLLFGAIVAFVIVAVSWTLWRDKRRRQELKRAAEILGFSFEPDGSRLLEEGLSEIPLFTLASLGRQSAISNVMRGEAKGTRMIICDYHYWTGSTASQRFDYSQTVACFQLKKQLPSFALRPRGGALKSGMERLGLNIARTMVDQNKLSPPGDPRAAVFTRLLECPIFISGAKDRASRPKFSRKICVG